MIDKRAIRAGVDEQHRPAPAQADDALHEAPIERGAFHSAFRQDDIGIDEQRREQLGIGHGRAEHAGGLLAVPIAEHLEALYAGAEERAGEGQREIARAGSKHAPALEMAEHAPGQLHGRLGQRRRRSGRIRRGQSAGQTGGRRSEPGQGIAQRGRLPRLRQGARPTDGQRVRQARRAERPAASQLRQLPRSGKPVAFPGKRRAFPGSPSELVQTAQGGEQVRGGIDPLGEIERAGHLPLGHSAEKSGGDIVGVAALVGHSVQLQPAVRGHEESLAQAPVPRDGAEQRAAGGSVGQMLARRWEHRAARVHARNEQTHGPTPPTPR